VFGSRAARSRRKDARSVNVKVKEYNARCHGCAWEWRVVDQRRQGRLEEDCPSCGSRTSDLQFVRSFELEVEPRRPSAQ